MVAGQGFVCVTVTAHPRQQRRAFTRPRRPRRLTSKRWPNSFPHWLAQDTAILAPTNCGWGSLGWEGPEEWLHVLSGAQPVSARHRSVMCLSFEVRRGGTPPWPTSASCNHLH